MRTRRGAFASAAVTGAGAAGGRARLHPSVWIAGWIAVAMLLQGAGLRWLALLATPIFALVAWFAAADAWRLIRRARWLLLAVAALFLLATPGERLPGPAGVAGLTMEGLAAAAEHLLRLLLLLTTLAWLLRVLQTDGLMAGLYCLLHPLGRLRDRIVVRLLLALEQVRREPAAGEWRSWLDASAPAGVERVSLAVAELRLSDRLALAGCLLVALVAVLK